MNRRFATIPAFVAATLLLVAAPSIARPFTQQTPGQVSAQSAPRASTAQPVDWSSLDPGQRRMLAPLQGRWNELPPQRQRRLAAHATRWAALPAAHQQQILQRLGRWAAMTPQERSRLRANARAFHRMSPEERARVHAAYERFRSLPSAERRALMRRWRAMPPGQRLRWANEHADAPAAASHADR